MPTECKPESFDFGMVEGRVVEAAFDGGLVTSDAGALLLKTTDRAIGLINRFATCFHDGRRADLIEHEVATLVGQRVFAIALGYEDLNDHDELRHDPMMAVLAGKLTAKREECAPVAGKSTLNRLELSRLQPTRSIKYQLTVAKLPLAKDFDDFQFDGTPINETLVRDLAGGGFLAQQRNAVLVGGTGTGKTHLAIAIGRSCIRSGT